MTLSNLRAAEAIASAKPKAISPHYSPLSKRFVNWAQRHRGLAPSTVTRYQRALLQFFIALGEEPGKYTAGALRGYVIEQMSNIGRDETRSAVTAIRAFLRFLVAEGQVLSGLQHCVPTVPQWRLSSLPRYLEAPDVERVVNSCNLTTGHAELSPHNPAIE